MKKYLFLLPLFFSFFVVNNTFAVSDITYTFDSTSANGSWFDICVSQGNSGTKCSDYTYMLVEFNDFVVTSNDANSNKNSYLDFVIQKGVASGSSISSSYHLRCNAFESQLCLYKFTDFNFNVHDSIGFNATRFWVNSNWSYTITLSESNPFETECPEPEEPEPCQECSNLTYHDDFEGVKVAIYTCGAILIVLYFFYCNWLNKCKQSTCYYCTYYNSKTSWNFF